MKTNIIPVLTALLLGYSTAQAQEFVPFPGDVEAIVQEVTTSGSAAGPAESLFNRPGFVREVLDSAWKQARGPACKGLTSKLGKGDLITDGITLYDLDCALGESGELEVKSTTLSPGSPLEIRYTVRGNSLTFTSTLPGPFGKYADPRVSCLLDAQLVIKLNLPTKPGPIKVQSVTGGFANAKFDSHNLPADIAFAVDDIIHFFGGPDFIVMGQDAINGTSKDLTGLVNQGLAPLNKILSDQKNIATIESLLKQAGAPAGVRPRNQSTKGASAPGPQLVMTMKKVGQFIGTFGTTPPNYQAMWVYGITPSGDLMWYRKDSGSTQWQGPKKAGNGWKFKAVIPAGGNSLYALTDDGRMLWYRHDGFNDGSFQWKGPVTVFQGWEFSKIFSGGDGIVYAIKDDGSLVWNRSDAGDSNSWSGFKVVGSGWGEFKNVFSTGEGDIYAVKGDGSLVFYKHKGFATGNTEWEGPRTIGNGWQDFTQIIPAGTGTILAIKPDGKLVLYKHTVGRLVVKGQTGRPDKWEGPIEIGTGWQSFEKVVALLPVTTPQEPR